jgi:hypothetical protein
MGIVKRFEQFNSFSKLNDTNINKIINTAKINGFGGHCGIFAIALNRVLFNSEALYVVSTNENTWVGDNPELDIYAHVGLVYDGWLCDSSGIQNEDDFISLGMFDEDEINPTTNKPFGEGAYDGIYVYLEDFYDTIDEQEEALLIGSTVGREINKDLILEQYISKLTLAKNNVLGVNESISDYPTYGDNGQKWFYIQTEYDTETSLDFIKEYIEDRFRHRILKTEIQHERHVANDKVVIFKTNLDTAIEVEKYLKELLPHKEVTVWKKYWQSVKKR